MGVFGPALAAFLIQFGAGLKYGFSKQPAGRKDRIAARFDELSSLTEHGQDQLDFMIGYGKGIASGVWGEIKGIVDLILLVPRLQLRANEWLLSQMGNLKNAEVLLKKGTELYEELASVSAKFGEEILQFFGDPLKATKNLAALLEEILSAGLSKAYELGQGSVEAAFQFDEKPFPELGEELGKIVGVVLFNVLLLVATDAIGNLIAKGAGAAAWLGRKLLEGAAEVFKGVQVLAGEFLSLMRTLGGTLFKAFEGTMEGLTRVIQRVEAFFAQLAELSAPELGLAGPGKAPPKVFMSEGSTAATKPVRTTTTTLEDLRLPESPRGNVPKEMPAPKRPAMSEAPFDQPLTAAERELTPEQLEKKVSYPHGATLSRLASRLASCC